MRVTVVGAGIMGLATAWALARDGHAVTVYEQGALPNPLGSSVDQHRLIRHPYGAERGYTRMINEAYAGWGMLWRDLGTVHYAQTGTLVLDRGDRWTAETLAALTREAVPFRRIATTELARRYPLLDMHDVREGILLESGGTLFADRIVASLAGHLRQRGVTIATNSPVSGVDPERGRIIIDGRGLDADLVVVAAGPWAPRLLPTLRPRVIPSRQVVVYLQPPAALANVWPQHPMILDLDPSSGFYLVPPREGTGLKVGDHTFSLSGDPDRDRTASAEEARAIVARVGRRLRDVEHYAIREAKTCFYDVEPQEHFIVERLGAHGWVLSGFSGHGFKFGAVIGLELARTIGGHRTPEDLAAWAAGRLPNPA